MLLQVIGAPYPPLSAARPTTTVLPSLAFTTRARLDTAACGQQQNRGLDQWGVPAAHPFLQSAPSAPPWRRCCTPTARSLMVTDNCAQCARRALPSPACPQRGLPCSRTTPRAHREQSGTRVRSEKPHPRPTGPQLSTGASTQTQRSCPSPLHGGALGQHGGDLIRMTARGEGAKQGDSLKFTQLR